MLRPLLLLLALSCQPAADRAVDAPHAAARAALRTFPNGIDLLPTDNTHPWRFGSAMSSGDFDGDGVFDLAVGQPGQATLGLHSGTGVRINQRPDRTYTQSTPGFGRQLSGVGDVDNDGFDDLVVGCATDAASPSVAMYFGGLNSLPTRPTRTVPAADEASAAGDVDGDGIGDVLFVSHADGVVSWLPGGGAARSAPPSVLYIDPTGALPDLAHTAAGAGDVDRDGFDDVVVAQPDRACVYYGSITGPALAGASCVLYASGPAPVAAAGDVDGDGFGDVILGDRLFHGSSAGPVRPVVLPSAGAPVDRVGLGDFDADGFDDIAVSDAGGAAPQTWILLGDPEGLSPFPIQTITGVAADDSGAALGVIDTNGDDYPDLLIGAPGFTTDSGRITVVRGAEGDGDHDGDGYAAPDDCDNRDPAASPEGTDLPGAADRSCDGLLDCFADADRDGFRGAGTVPGNDADCADPGEAPASAATDCDDADNAITNGGPELPADGVDADCDGTERCYADADGDGWIAAGDAGSVLSDDLDCDDPGEADGSASPGDCDDTVAAANPNGVEDPGDGVDGDCDGTEICFEDLDADGYGSSNLAFSADADCDDPDEAGSSGDCADGEPGRNPGIVETPGVDGDLNCDGRATCWADADRDGARGGGTVLSTDLDCRDPGEATGAAAADCDDLDAFIGPNASDAPGDGIDQDCTGGEPCYVDADEDGYRSDLVTEIEYTVCLTANEAAPESASLDCNDDDANVSPGESEVDANGVDDNCDGGERCYRDTDGDGFRGSALFSSADDDCLDAGEALASAPAGDCDDNDPAKNPGIDEPVGIDLDCSGTINCYIDDDRDGLRSNAIARSPDLDCLDPGEAEASADLDCDDQDPTVLGGACAGGGAVTCFADLDRDGFRTDATIASADGDCIDPGEAGVLAPQGDCDDFNAATYPGAAEQPGDEDDGDCDGTELCYVDGDNDGFRTGDNRDVVASEDLGCGDPGEARGSTPTDDCDDADPTFNPGAPELRGGGDEDCDGRVLCGVDEDDDGWPGESSVSLLRGDCALDGYSIYGSPGDCNDADPAFNPEAVEAVQSPIDYNCDLLTNCYADRDNDGARTDALITSSDPDCDDRAESPADNTLFDCDDFDASVGPDAEEIVGNDVDNDCDGFERCYSDEDNDGYRTEAVVQGASLLCTGPGEASLDNARGDCDDDDATVYPFAVDPPADGADTNCDGRESCYQDRDDDGYRIDVLVPSADPDCDDAGEAYAGEPDGDCSDVDGNRYPNAVEDPGAVYDANCDGRVFCLPDADADGYGGSPSVLSADADCNDAGEIRPGGTPDCDDSDRTISPGALETPSDGIDNDCDGIQACYTDADDDRYYLDVVIPGNDNDCGDPGEAGPGDDPGDCDDANAGINPGATEAAADGVDANCDGTEICRVDVDRDGYQGQGTVVSADGDCSDPGEATSGAASGDCDDEDPAVNPGAVDAVGDSIDGDCDGAEACFQDADGDGWPHPTATVASDDDDCDDEGELGGRTGLSDCNDDDATVAPTATEVAGDNVDGNCDGAETCYTDADDDGYRSLQTRVSADTDCDDAGEALASAPSGDCDDNAAATYAGANDPAGDGIDQDCDGVDTAGESGCACDATGRPAPLWPLAGLLLALRRRRA